MTTISLATFGIWGLILTVGYLAYRLFISSKVNYPPGPRPYPVIGNPFDIPPSFQEVAFANLAKKYGAVSFLETLYQAWSVKIGDVLHVSVFGKDFIILSTFEDARELMDKRSAIYSSRPRFVLLVEMCVFTSVLHDVYCSTDHF
jgi:hypothetical protein